MDGRFDTRRRLVLLTAQLSGPTATATVTLAVDTGAARSVIRPSLLLSVGCDPSRSASHIRVVSATGTERAPVVRVDHLLCAGTQRGPLWVAAHDLPSRFDGDGLLGLDFIRPGPLSIDFIRGRVFFSPRRWWRLWR
ncbi:MAG TPA: retropepsin-like aspartic protease [Fimbriiglobus sp.]|nr:retropepsin-like aspartic protease [Fimbriiglobus sp.]